MYDAAKLFRSVFVCIFLGVFLVNAAVAGYHGYPYETCYPTFQVACDVLKAYEIKNKPANWQNFQWHTTKCSENRFEGYITGTMDGEPVGGNRDTYIHGYAILKCEYKGDKQCESKKGQKFREGEFTYSVKPKDASKLAASAIFGGQRIGSCDNGCLATGNFGGIECIGAGTPQEKCWARGIEATYTGTSCDSSNDGLGLPDPKPEQPTDPQDPAYTPDPKDGIVPGWSSAPDPTTGICPRGRCPGQVNGMDVCVKCDSTTSGTSTSTSKTDAAGNTSKDKTDSATTCKDGKCTTTTSTTTSTSTSSTSTTSTSTTVQSQSNYCAKNPQDKVNCTGDGKKDGEGEDECKSNPLRLGCLSLGTVPKDSTLPKGTKEVRYQEAAFTTGAGCPAPKTFQVFGNTYEMSFQQLCDMAKYIKPLVLLIASITTMFIVILGMKR